MGLVGKKKFGVCMFVDFFIGLHLPQRRGTGRARGRELITLVAISAACSRSPFRVEGELMYSVPCLEERTRQMNQIMGWIWVIQWIGTSRPKCVAKRFSFESWCEDRCLLLKVFPSFSRAYHCFKLWAVKVICGRLLRFCLDKPIC